MSKLTLWQQRWLVAGTAVLAALLYVGLSARGGGPGFPLDDGWIHQTYARNLASSGRWEYVPGIVSAGSTAPLWTLLLTAGYLLHMPYLWWAFALGIFSLIAVGWSGMALWRQLWPSFAEQSWLPGLTLVLTWPLLWAAVSGMETLLFAALGLAALVLLGQLVTGERPLTDYRRLALLGILSGLLILTRPDGLVLLLLIGLGLLLTPARLPLRVRSIAIWLGMALLPLLPYFAFNLRASGAIWPNTFYAKQAEYAVELARPFLLRLSQLLYFSLGGSESGWRGISGAHLLLLPGLVVAGWLALRADWQARRLWALLPLLWAGGHVFLYAWRLPVTYQHGRYLMAALPLWVLYGLAGWQILLQRLGGNGRVVRLGRQVAGVTFAVLLLLFLLLGASAYADDVAFIEGEMVTVAHWLAANTPEDALIAAHDIGAIGFFAERPLLDLAGLVSPETITLLGDETAVADYILHSSANYLVTAPGWPYTAVTTSPASTFLFSTDFAWTQEQGRNNMTVYALNQQ
ncbi:MAG: hypothetical protein H6660_02370 [Ardenticatenaceae bacterium]|nr:hypothetical protein [Ardenticatenaceae bacterium]